MAGTEPQGEQDYGGLRDALDMKQDLWGHRDIRSAASDAITALQAERTALSEQVDDLEAEACEFETIERDKLAAEAELAKLRAVVKALLSFEDESASFRDLSGCTCILHSRQMDRAYEAGECPHQKAKAALDRLGQGGEQKK